MANGKTQMAQGKIVFKYGVAKYKKMTIEKDTYHTLGKTMFCVRGAEISHFETVALAVAHIDSLKGGE